MRIIINSSSMIPIYEQIVNQIKSLIVKGELKENEALPSVRSLSKDLNISALTVKKAYDFLEQEGFTKTVHGKGTYVSRANADVMMEMNKKEIEDNMNKVIEQARAFGLKDEEIRTLFDVLMEE